MYVAKHYETPQADIDACLDQLRSATLVTVDPDTGRPEATMLPWSVSRDPLRLRTHLGRNNRQWQHTSSPALIIVQGPETLLDATVLNGFDQGQAAPTWLYETIHLYGTLTAHQDPEWIKQSWAEMHDQHDTVQPYDSIDQGWADRLVPACVGVEVEVTEIIGKSKLAQNKTPGEVRRSIDQLNSRCPHLADRLTEISLPYAEHRQAVLNSLRS
jgi:transcriptional regulator